MKKATSLEEQNAALLSALRQVISSPNFNAEEHENVLEILNEADLTQQCDSVSSTVNDDAPYIPPGATRHFGNLPLSSAVTTTGRSIKEQKSQLEYFRRPVWACTPLISDSASRLDPFSFSVLSFRDFARQMIESGHPKDLILSTSGMRLEVLYRDKLESEPHTVSTWACSLCKTFKEQPQLSLLAGILTVGSIMRWLINPTPETYQAIPEHQRPLPAQFLIPHSIGVEVVWSPEARESMLTLTRDWATNVSQHTVNVNWPYSIDDCVQVAFEDQGDGVHVPMLKLSKLWVDHISDYSNITIDKAMLKHFPELEGRWRTYDPEAVVKDESKGLKVESRSPSTF